MNKYLTPLLVVLVCLAGWYVPSWYLTREAPVEVCEPEGPPRFRILIETTSAHDTARVMEFTYEADSMNPKRAREEAEEYAVGCVVDYARGGRVVLVERID